jgi:hypothetical protein
MCKLVRGVVCCGELKRGGLGWSDKTIFLGWGWG